MQGDRCTIAREEDQSCSPASTILARRRIPVAAFEQVDGRETEDETPDVRPPRHATRGARFGRERERALEQLHHEPQSQHDHRRELDDLKDDDDRNEHDDARAG